MSCEEGEGEGEGKLPSVDHGRRTDRGRDKNKIGNKQDSVEDKEQTIHNLQQKIMNEQDINDQSEEEII
jgi:hypothetical protein